MHDGLPSLGFDEAACALNECVVARFRRQDAWRAIVAVLVHKQYLRRAIAFVHPCNRTVAVVLERGTLIHLATPQMMVARMLDDLHHLDEQSKYD